MPRNYVPKPKDYSDKNLQDAIESVQNGNLSYREAETKYKVDKSLIWRRIHNYNTSKQGRKTVLSMVEEKDLAEKIKIMAKWGWALTRKEISEIVHDYIVQNNIRNNFKENIPGKDWMELFFKRNGLVGKKMEQLEKSRRQATSDPFIIYGFYDILEETLSNLDLHDKPEQVFNLDETSISSDPSRIKGVTGKGQKAHRIIQGSGKDNTTVLGCISADGKIYPPLIIFKSQNLWSSWKGTKDIPGTTYACSDNGWMVASIFNEWFANFCKSVTKRPLLIIFDGHATHLDPATIALAMRENVALLKLPAHTTDLLQPLDRSCFGPIKYKWNERLIEWQRLNQRSLSKSEFCDLLCEVWRDGPSKEVIQNSFRVTGLFPVNKDVYPKDRFDPIKLERYNKSLLNPNVIANPMNIFENLAAQSEERCVSPSIISETVALNVSEISQDHNLQDAIVQVVQSEVIEKEKLATTVSSAAVSAEANNILVPSCSFETLLLNKIKHTKPETGKRRKIDSKGKLLTSEEYLKSIENIENKQKRTKIKEPKKKKLKQKSAPVLSDTDTDIEEEIVYEDESDLDNVSWSEIIDQEQDYELDELQEGNNVSKPCELQNQHDHDVSVQAENHKVSTVQTIKDTPVNVSMDEQEFGIGDFILVGHTTKKNTMKYYLAKIEGSEDNENLTVIYLKRKKKIFFAYPATNIIYSINKNEIIMKLPNPLQKNKRGLLMFDVDLEKYHIE